MLAYNQDMSLSTPSLGRVLRRGTQRGLATAVREEGWGASVGSLFGVLFFAQVLLILVIGVNAGLTLLREQTDIRLEILDNASQAQIQDLVQNLHSLPYVEDVVYITREEAYERQKQRDPQLIAFLQKFGIANPFPETLGVRLRSLDDYTQFVSFLQQPVFAKTINPAFLSQGTDQQTQIYKLLDIVRSARLILFLIVGLLLVVLVFIIIELVRRRAVLRGDELFVEQLVGATPMAILLPFSVEILTLLFFALLLSFLFATGFVYVLPILIPSLAPGGVFSVWAASVAASLLSTGWLIACLELIVLPIVAGVGTFLALWPRLSASTLSVA